MRGLVLGLGIATACLAPWAGPAAGGVRWLHVHVDETGEDGKQVRVNVPASMVEALTPELKKHIKDDSKFSVGRCELTSSEYRDAIRTLGRSRVGHVVQKREKGHRVVLKRHGDDLHVEGFEERNGDLRTRARMPWDVAQALAAGSGEQLDVAGALRKFVSGGDREIAVTDHDGTKVRIWVDETAFTETDA